MSEDFFKKFKASKPPFIDAIECYTYLDIMRLVGPIDISTVPDMQRFIETHKKNADFLSKDFLVDFKKVTTLDGTAVAQFLIFLHGLKKRKRKLALMNVPSKFMKLLEISKIESYFVICESETKAFSQILEWSQEW